MKKKTPDSSCERGVGCGCGDALGGDELAGLLLARLALATPRRSALADAAGDQELAAQVGVVVEAVVRSGDDHRRHSDVDLAALRHLTQRHVAVASHVAVHRDPGDQADAGVTPLGVADSQVSTLAHERADSRVEVSERALQRPQERVVVLDQGLPPCALLLTRRSWV